MKKITLVIAILLTFLSIDCFSQTTYYSKAVATDFNSTASWGTETDGTGTAPASISNADNFVVGNNAVLSLTGNATVRQLTIGTGTLNVAANTLTVSKAGTFDSSFTVNNGGTLNQSGGTIAVNGNVLFANGSNFTQSAGTLSVDGNNGGSTTGSVAAGTPIFAVGTSGTTYASGTMSLTGGKIIIVDPHASTGSDYAFITYLSSNTNNITAGTGHTLQIGDGVSTDAGGNATNGYWIYFWNNTGAFKAGNFVVNALPGTNRHVLQQYKSIVGGNLTITNGELRYTVTGPYNVAGNIYVDTNGIFTNSLTLVLGDGTYTSSTAITNAPALTAQTVSGPGIFRNSATTVTANFANLQINNTSAAGISFAGTNNVATQPANSVSVSGTLTFTAGKVSTTGGATVVLGNSSPSAGTLSYTSGGFTSGTTFGRWYTAAGTGTSFTAGSDATSATSRYPFINSLNQDRSAWIERVSPVAAAGVLGMTFTEGLGTSAVNVTDVSATPNYTVDTKSNSTWSVSSIQGTPLAATSFKLQLQTPGLFGGPLSNANARIIQGSAFVGTHQAGTVTPGAQRIALTPAEITAAPFSIAVNSADIAFSSIASGDWNNPATWNKNMVPGCNDVVYIAGGNVVTVNSAGNVAKNAVIVLGGTLAIASGDLTIGCTLNNASLVNNGTLSISGGTLNLNGSFNMNNGANLSQSGGDFNIDGNNNGDAATSVASGTPIFRIGNSSTSFSTGTISLTGGTITIVDPHTATTNTNAYAVYCYFPSGVNFEASALHTFKFGNGTSTDAGGNTSGFYVDPYVNNGRLNLGKVIVNNPSGTNRNVTTPFATGVHGDLNVVAGEFKPTALILEGNLNVTGGTYLATGNLNLAIPSGTSTVVNTVAQTIGYSGTGVIKNLATAETANLTSLTVNNNSAGGVTLASPIAVSGNITLTSGVVNTSNTNLLTHGTATAAGSLTGGSATAYIKGPIARTIASGNANTNYILFPVGKAVYAPLWLAPATTAVTVIKAETFGSNTGTADASIINLATGRRWEAPIVSGTVTSVNVRLGDPNIVTGNIPVMADSAAGAYSGAFGSVATFATATPNTIQSTVATTNYTGFLSYAISNVCMGTPAPGNTIVSTNNLCAGASVTFTVENITPGSGVTYQWQSSADGVNYQDVTGATSTSYTTVPTASLYYKLKVTCSAGPAIGYSVPVQITFANQVVTTTPGSVCGQGTVTLGATGNSGSTISWYTAQTGGAPVGSGNTYTTPSLTATTTYYAAAQAVGGSVAGGKLAPEPTWDGFATTDWGIVFNALTNITLNSVDVYSTSAGTLNVKVVNSAGTELYATGNVNVAAGGVTTPTTISLNNLSLPAGTNYKILVKAYSGVNLIRGSVSGFPYTNDNISVTASEWGGTTTGTYYFFYNIQTTGLCSSARVPVVATVTPAPTLTLSGNPATICAGQSTTPVTLTAGNGDYDSFTWSPATGVSGNAASGWTFNPAVSTVYTLTATQSAGSMCTATATVNVTINPLPAAITIAPAAPNACPDVPVQLAINGAVMSGDYILGTATTLTGTTEQPTAFLNRWPNYWSQTVYTAQELTALGMGAGNILSMAYNITTLGDAATNANFTVKIGTTGQSNFANTTFLPTTGFTTVYGPQTYTHTATGWQVINFTTPFVWDGVSNIIVDVKYDGANALYNSQTYYTATADNKVLWKNSYDSSTTTGTVSPKRLNVKFGFDAYNNIVWSPATNLYTDANATVPYVAGTNALALYYKSSTAGAAAITATSTTQAGCTVTATATVTVNITAAPTVANASQTFCGGATVANLTATGTALQWYAAATGGTALAGTTALTNGTTYYASQTLNGCESQTRTAVTATVNVTAAPTANAAQTFCNAATVAELTATGTAIQWYAAATGGTALAGTTALANGTYYASQTLNGCESATRTAVTVTVNVTAAPTANAAQTFCGSGTVSNLTATGTGIQWYAAATGGTALAGTAALTNGTTYYASQTLNGCESATRTAVTVTISTVAAPVTTLTQPGCGDTTGSITVTSPVGAGFTYSLNGTNFQSSATFANLLPGAYTVTVMNTASCTAVSGTLTINAAPAVPSAPVATVTQPGCGDTTGSVTVTAPVGAGLTYSINGTNFQSSASFANLAAGDYTVTVMNTSGCSATALVTVNAAPAVPAVPSVTVVQPTCASATGSITVASPVGAGLTYSIDGNNFQSSAMFNDLAAGTYTITVMNAAGCSAVSAAIVINNAPAVPATPTVSLVQPDCTSATGMITVTSPAGAEYTYSINGTDFQASAMFMDVMPGTYTLTVMNTAGCTSVLVVTIDDAPVTPQVPTVTLAQPTCAVAGSITVTAPVGAGYSYSINGTDFQSSPVFADVASGTYTVTVESAGGCSAALVGVVIDDAPVTAAPTGDAEQVITVSAPEDATIASLVATGDTGATITWYASLEDALSGTGALSSDTQLTDGATYYAVQTVGECTSTEALAVTVSVVLGRDGFEKDAFSYYPNPVKDILTITSGSDITGVEVFNMLGQQVMFKNANGMSVNLDMSVLSDGTYLVNVKTGTAFKTIKVVKKQ